MKLYVARHGHAELTPDSATGKRKLTEEGIAEVSKVADYLAKQGLHVSHVMHSDKERAIQTAKILGSAIATDLATETTAMLGPDQPVKTLIDHLNTWDDDTLLVGHMPFVSHLISALILDNESFDIVRFTPGTLVCLQRYEGQRWVLSWILRPELVPDD